MRKSSVITVGPATKTPESWVRASADQLTAVFDMLPLTTMPLERPAPRPAAPSPISSRLASTLVVAARGVGRRRSESLGEGDELHAAWTRGRGPRSQPVDAEVREKIHGVPHRRCDQNMASRGWVLTAELLLHEDPDHWAFLALEGVRAPSLDGIGVHRTAGVPRLITE